MKKGFIFLILLITTSLLNASYWDCEVAIYKKGGFFGGWGFKDTVMREVNADSRSGAVSKALQAGTVYIDNFMGLGRTSYYVCNSSDNDSSCKFRFESVWKCERQ